MMLVAPLLQQGVKVKLPTAENIIDKPETQEQTVLAISKDRALYVNAKPVTDADLTKRIMDTLEAKKEKVVLIRADEEVDYGAVMSAMDHLREAGVEDIGLVTEPKQTTTPGQSSGAH
jgi:biopolymer transport protein ExbD